MDYSNLFVCLMGIGTVFFGLIYPVGNADEFCVPKNRAKNHSRACIRTGRCAEGRNWPRADCRRFRSHCRGNGY